MQMSNMFPPGHVLWAMRDSDLHPSHRSYLADTSRRAQSADKLRLFEVLDVEKVFSQIVFARDMLTCVPSHLPYSLLLTLTSELTCRINMTRSCMICYDGQRADVFTCVELVVISGINIVSNRECDCKRII